MIRDDKDILIAFDVLNDAKTAVLLCFLDGLNAFATTCSDTVFMDIGDLSVSILG